MTIWELLRPYYQIKEYKKTRWTHNLALMLFNSILIHKLFSISAAAIALWAESESIGLFNKIDLPIVVEITLGLIILDLFIYTQHLIFHKVPFLWKNHRVHHADINFDVTTALRFHPFELMLSMVIKIILIYFLGISVLCFLLFEIILNGMAMFNHSNITLTASLDKMIRYMFVTPDMHRIHHSIDPRDLNSNYGFNLSWWDRLFGTYRKQVIGMSKNFTIGLSLFQDPKYLKLHWILVIPFLKMREFTKK